MIKIGVTAVELIARHKWTQNMTRKIDERTDTQNYILSDKHMHIKFFQQHVQFTFQICMFETPL